MVTDLIALYLADDNNVPISIKVISQSNITIIIIKIIILLLLILLYELYSVFTYLFHCIIIISSIEQKVLTQKPYHIKTRRTACSAALKIEHISNIILWKCPHRCNEATACIMCAAQHGNATVGILNIALIAGGHYPSTNIVFTWLQHD